MCAIIKLNYTYSDVGIINSVLLQYGILKKLVTYNFDTEITNGLLLVKSYDNKKVRSPYNWFISPLTQPEVANQLQKKDNKKSTSFKSASNFLIRSTSVNEFEHCIDLVKLYL